MIKRHITHRFSFMFYLFVSLLGQFVLLADDPVLSICFDTVQLTRAVPIFENSCSDFTIKCLLYTHRCGKQIIIIIGLLIFKLCQLFQNLSLPTVQKKSFNKMTHYWAKGHKSRILPSIDNVLKVSDTLPLVQPHHEMHIIHYYCYRHDLSLKFYRYET